MKQNYLKSFFARFLTLLVLALMSTNLAWGDEETCTFPKTGTISNNSVTVGNVTWTIGTTVEKGSPTTTFGNAYSQTCIKFGSGASNCYKSVTLSTDYFKNKGYAVTGVSVLGIGSAARDVTFTIGNNSTTVNVAANSWTSLSLTNLNITGDLSLKFDLNSAGFFVHEIKVTYSASTPSVEAPTFSVAAGNYTEAQTVELSCATEGATIHYTTDGTEPSAESTPYESAITVDHSMTIKAIAIKGDDKSTVATAAYKINVFTSLEDLVAAEIADGTTVKVSFENVMITDIYTNSSDKRVGIFLNVKAKNDKDIEIYFNNTNDGKTVPDAWIVGGKVSGTLTCPWTYYKNGDVWELCPDKDSEWTWGELTYTAPTTYNIIIADDIQNGTVEADMEKAAAGVEVTLTVTPDEGYKLGILTVKDATEADVPVEDNKFTMPAYNVTVSATFEAIPTHDAKFFVNGVQSGETQNVYEGDAVVFPANPAGIGTKKFVGWTASPMAEVSDEAPEFVKSATMETEDLNFYAVFAEKVEGDGTYRKITSALSDWRGDYLIAYSSEIFANGKKGGTDTDCLGKQNNNVKPESNLSKDGNIVFATWGDEYYVTLEKIDDSNTYLLKTQDGKYNYQSSNTNGLSATENKSTAANYPISVNFISSDEINLALGGSAAGAVFRYNPDGYFRFYKNGGQQPIYLYKKQEATYSGYCTTITSTNIVISEAGWATVCLPFKATITSGNATAYYVTGTNETALTKDEADVIPAGEGILLKSNDGGKATVTFTISDKDADAVTGNMMKGAITETTFDESGYKYYILANGKNGLGFYYQGAENDGSTVTCAAGKAILAVPTTSSAKAFFSLDNEPTGITSYENDNDNENLKAMTVYNLNGMKVNNSYKGIVIMNGKKYINK